MSTLDVQGSYAPEPVPKSSREHCPPHTTTLRAGRGQCERCKKEIIDIHAIKMLMRVLCGKTVR